MSLDKKIVVQTDLSKAWTVAPDEARLRTYAAVAELAVHTKEAREVLFIFQKHSFQLMYYCVTKWELFFPSTLVSSLSAVRVLRVSPILMKSSAAVDCGA